MTVTITRPSRGLAHRSALDLGPIVARTRATVKAEAARRVTGPTGLSDVAGGL